MKLLCVFCYLLVNYCVRAEDGTTCVTPNEEIGTCLSIFECPLLLDVVAKANTMEEKSFLRKSLCGWVNGSQPKVCCGTKDAYITQAFKPRASENNINSLLPNRTKCGFQDTDKILGGTATDIAEFPWMALLVYNDRANKTSFKCGGVLINERYVLTAAHCKRRGLMGVRLGEWSISNKEDCVPKGLTILCSRHIDVDIETVKIHENYTSDSKTGLLNDIALIRLKAPVKYTSFIQPICLPTTETNIIGKNLWVSGWGVTNTETFASSDIKQKARMKVISFPECKTKFKERNRDPQIYDSHICAFGEDSKSSCFGDSGNPFVTTVSGEVAQFYVEGIVSYGGIVCNDMPVVFTRVYRFLDWIDDNIRP